MFSILAFEINKEAQDTNLQLLAIVLDERIPMIRF